MNIEQKREAIRLKVVEAIPEIRSLPTYPYNPDSAKALLKLEEVVSRNHETKEMADYCALHIENYEKQRIRDYILMLQNNYKGRPINALDILRALRADIELAHIDCLGRLYRHNVYVCELDLSQNLSQWSPETIDELYKLMCE